MFDINAINTLFNTAINEAVAQATVALTERVAHLETQAAAAEAQLMAVRDRIAALENNPAQGVGTPATITADAFVTHLDNQEWFWEKLDRRIEAATEQAVDNHCETYDHDNYDAIVSKVDDMSDPDDLVTRDELRSEIEDVLNNCSLSISI